MPDNHRRTPNPIAITTTVSRELAARLQQRADLQGLSRAEIVRNLIAASLAPSPPRGGDAAEE
jgi:hypothetical protein